MPTCRGYLYTINNPLSNDYEEVKKICDDTSVKYYAWQTERGESGTLHIQGYVEYKNAVRATKVTRALSRAHVESRKGTPWEAWNYCTKDARGTLEEDEDFSDNSTTEPPTGPGSRSDLNSIATAVLRGDAARDIAMEYPGQWIRYGRGIRDLMNVIQPPDRPAGTKPEIVIYFGKTGAGKTRKAVDDNPSLYIVDQGTNGNVWFTGYKGESTILVDDFYGWIKYSFLLRFTDRYSNRLPVHQGSTPNLATKIIFTSNERPSQWYRNIDMSAFFRRVDECWYFNDNGSTMRLTDEQLRR